MTTSESKGWFKKNESIRIDSHNEWNLLDLNRELECSTVDEFCWQRDPLAVAKFSKSRVWGKVLEGSTRILETSEFPYNTVWDRWKETAVREPARFVQSFRYNTGLWQTDTWRLYIASRSKMDLLSANIYFFLSLQ